MSYGIVGQVVTITKVIFQVIDCSVTRLGLFCDKIRLVL